MEERTQEVGAQASSRTNNGRPCARPTHVTQQRAVWWGPRGPSEVSPEDLRSSGDTSAPSLPGEAGHPQGLACARGHHRQRVTWNPGRSAASATARQARTR